ncbi:MAG: hypothetical protein WD689_00875 [Gaiellaceae bacterium]
MSLLRRALKIAAGALAAVLYLWFAGVRNAARAKRSRARRARARASAP